jgi:hypothetical protein
MVALISQHYGYSNHKRAITRREKTLGLTEMMLGLGKQWQERYSSNTHKKMQYSTQGRYRDGSVGWLAWNQNQK